MDKEKTRRPAGAFVSCIENHDQAFYIWREKKAANRTLVHIDAHSDIAWFNDRSVASVLAAGTGAGLEELLSAQSEYNPSPDSASGRPDIGNYICQAVREGMVDKIYCVFPDDFFATGRTFKYWKKYLHGLVNAVPGAREKVSADSGRLVSRFINCELVFCTLDSLPAINEEVLLDIDTDFYVTDFKNHGWEGLVCLEKKLPWIWPDEFISRLEKKIPRYDIVTIAYSVEGYFTPLEFKWLGDYTRLLLDPPGGSGVELKAMESAKRASALMLQSKAREAAEIWRDITAAVPRLAFAHYNLSRALHSCGDQTKAAEQYALAGGLDPSYRTAFNNPGRLLMRCGLSQKAREEFEKILFLDPGHYAARCGIAEIYFREKKYGLALQELDNAGAISPGNVEIDYLKGELWSTQKKEEEAIAAFEAVIRKKPGHLGAYLNLGRLYSRRGSVDQAVHCYKCAMRLGVTNSSLCRALGVLYFKKRRFARGAAFFGRGLLLLFPSIFHEYGEWRQSRRWRRKIAGQIS